MAVMPSWDTVVDDGARLTESSRGRHLHTTVHDTLVQEWSEHLYTHAQIQCCHTALFGHGVQMLWTSPATGCHDATDHIR